MEGVLRTGLLTMVWLACRTTSPGIGPPTIGWVLPHQSLIKKMPYSPLVMADAGGSL
ncbi:hypothetical protein I79_020185 [Cricetulus griseus]|uniref:Uncharacterized protein n=1 Tax=Cricetulus griseus TaxID=10029 RepID=G3I9E4_CRIGR|nr:hypothetical protein I79_020185 [Cricetulus griseus]